MEVLVRRRDDLVSFESVTGDEKELWTSGVADLTARLGVRVPVTAGVGSEGVAA